MDRALELLCLPDGALAMLEESERRYRLLAESATDAVSLRDPSGVYRYVSPSATALCGYRPEELVGRHASVLVHPNDRERVQAEQARLLAGEEVAEMEYRLVRRDGSHVWVHTTSRALRDSRTGEVTEVRTSTLDVTERRQREAELRATTDELTLRLRQTAAIVRLGEHALEEPDLDRFLTAATATVGDTLSVPLCVILEQDGAELRPRAGTGWPRGTAGRSMWVRVGERERPLTVLAVHAYEQHTFTAHDHTFLVAVANILRDAIARHRAEETARHDALHDPLTGLPNRRLLTDRLGQALARSARGGERHAVLFLDVDHFKRVNDSLGHDAGDRLLCALGPRLRDAVRPSDTVARFGGDEFVVLCEDVQGEQHAARIARRLTDALHSPFDLDGREHVASVSVGVAVTDGTPCTPDDVLRDADTAMYRAKESGRGCSEHFDARMRQSTLARLVLEDDLRRALARGELTVHYQPIHRIDDDRPAMVEALARWQHPSRGLLLPAEFITVAEETNLIVPLGAQILHEACEQVARWREALPAAQHLALSVNVSARQIAHAGYVDTVRETLAQTGLPGHALALEITEGVLLHDFTATAATITELRECGIRIVLDDFGTGWSSLSYLRRFSLDVLKIDRLFVTGVHECAEDWVIVEAIITMAHALALDVTAEGVETPEQLEALRELGSTHVQGNLLGLPLPAERIESLLRATDT